jgi:PAS domain S-box-containing protein
LYEAVQRHAAELEQRVIERTAELNHTTERVEAILNSSSDIIFLLSNEGIIQQANPAFGQVFNCEPETVFDQPLTILTEPDAAQTLLDALRATVESRQPQRVEIPVRYKESAVFDADMALSPTVERDHQTLGVVCSLRDITQRKELETRLRQTLEKEVELNQLKTRFVSMVSHEFRTPLAVIQTASELMLQYSDRMTEEQKRRELDHVLGGVEQMVELLDDVLVISRTEAGKLEFSPEPLDLQALCQGILAELRQTIGGAHHLEFSVTGECTDVVMDSKLLHHVIDNLLSNAIKYSPANSTVTFDLTCQWDQATLVIRDEGIGIPRADQVHLFETFHRAANVGTIPGTGLGLAIVKQAVQLHGGTITFESVEGAGTTFVVTIPNAPADEN